MTSWLDPVEQALGARKAPVTVFFRDDDGGWGDERLLALLDRFDRHGLPLDVAVIPTACEPALAHELRARHANSGGRLRLHQHGYAHENHEPDGKKQEFGPSRSTAQQRDDLVRGRARLEGLLGDALDPVFTPPWNRCTVDTGRCLLELGVHVLSREARVPALDLEGLAEVPVHVDWVAHRKGVPVGREQVGEQLAAALAGPGPVGVMFHHAVMGDDDMAEAGDLLSLLAGHAHVRTTSILALAEAGAPA